MSKYEDIIDNLKEDIISDLYFVNNIDKREEKYVDSLNKFLELGKLIHIDVNKLLNKYLIN